MNHIYRTLWNATLGAWVAAPETAGAGSKAGGSSCNKSQVRSSTPLMTIVAASLAVWLGGTLPAAAIPNSIHVLTGESKDTQTDYPLHSYGSVLIDQGGSLTVNRLDFGITSMLTNAGTLNVTNSGELGVELTASLHNTGTLNNSAVIFNQGTLENNGGTLTNSLFLVNGPNGLLVNQAGSVLVNNVNLINDGLLNNIGTLINNGDLLNGTGTLTNTGRLINNGSILLGPLAAFTNNGSLEGVGVIQGSVDMAAGSALLAGNADVPYGTLTINGNLVFNPGAKLQVRVNPISNEANLVRVMGTANLAGSVVHVGNQSNAATDFQVGKTYTILTAGAISGTFDGASSNFAYLDASLGYTPTDVTLALQRKPNVDFADLSNTPNQGAAARGIESLPSTHPLYQFVQTLPVGAPAAVFASLSGDTHASVNSAMGMLGAQAPAISQNHLRSNLTAGLRAGAPIAQSDGPLPASALPSSKALPAWVEVVGNWQRFNGNGNAPGLKQNTSGLFLGGDEEVGNSGWRVGGSVGYTQSDAKVNSRDASADISSYSAAVYTGKSFAHGANRVNVLGGLAYTHHSIESERTVASLGQNLKADYSAHTAQLFAEVGYAMGQYDKQGFEPFVGITLGEQRTNSFKESGGFAALSSESSRDTLASTTLGVRAHSDFVLAGKDTRVRASLGVRHAWGNLSQNRTMAFEGSSSFTVAGAPLARNTALVGLQAEMALSRYSALVLGYNGEYGSGSRDQSASVKVRWAF